MSEGHRRITVPNFVKIGGLLRRYCDFLNFQDGRRHLIFFKSGNFIDYKDPEGGDASSCQIGQSVAKILRFFDFTRWLPPPFEFSNLGILSADGVWWAQPHDCTKFRQNRSFCCGDIAIF